MRFRKAATPVQRIMVALMAIAFGALILWVIPELIGVFSPAAEDTYSEWVWDQNPWLVYTISAVQVLAGILLVGSAWHFLEGHHRRRRLERKDR